VFFSAISVFCTTFLLFLFDLTFGEVMFLKVIFFAIVCVIGSVFGSRIVFPPNQYSHLNSFRFFRIYSYDFRNSIQIFVLFCLSLFERTIEFETPAFIWATLQTFDVTGDIFFVDVRKFLSFLIVLCILLI
jgi:hypothetical protein